LRHPKIEEIFQAAIEVFAQSGFDQAKVDDIAKKARVAKGTIYYHFRSKEELFLGMISEGLEKLVEYVKRNILQSNDPREQLSYLVEAHLRFFAQNAPLAKIILQEAFDTKERQQEFRNHIRGYLQLIEELLEKGKNQGVFQFHHSSETASAIFGALSISALQKIFTLEDVGKHHNEQELQQWSDGMIRFILNGLNPS
jgi:AcrR family transcriptional regulator